MALVVSVQGHQIIYVDTENGILNSSCWEGGLDQPCGSLELADTGAQRYNSTIAVVLRHGTSCNASTTVLTTSKALSYSQLPTADNATCGCEPTVSRCNVSASIQKYDSVSSLSNNTSCHPWFEPSNGTCKCGETVHDIVKCNETLQESDCNCMTYNETTGTVVGTCFYNCVNVNWGEPERAPH